MKLMDVRRSLLLTSVCLMTVLRFETIAAEQKCTTNLGDPGVCLRPRACAFFNSYAGILPLLGVGAISVCSFGFFNLQICCPLERESTSPAPRSTRVTLHQTAENESSTATPAVLQIVENERKNVSRSYEPLLPPYCGRSDAAHDRIVGGNEAELNAWPWMAAVFFRFGDEPDETAFCCGGSLISSRHVLTAAHCLEYEEVTYLVRLGEHDLERSDDRAKPIDVAVESYVIHPEYNATFKENDIAIFRLERDVEFTKAIHPICLPIEKHLRNRDFVNTYPFVAGWGTTSYGGDTSNVLEEVQVRVISNEQCKKDYEGKDVVIDEGVLCAGWPSGGKDACQGDSGGPLMRPVRTTYYLIGVVSTGWKCAVAHFPGVYSRVTHFLDFIVANMK